MTVATTDGETTWAFRYSSEGRSRSLFHSTDVSTLRHQYPDNPMLHGCPTTPGSWCPSRWATCRAPGARCPRRRSVVVHGADDEVQPFAPVAP